MAIADGQKFLWLGFVRGKNKTGPNTTLNPSLGWPSLLTSLGRVAWELWSNLRNCSSCSGRGVHFPLPHPSSAVLWTLCWTISSFTRVSFPLVSDLYLLTAGSEECKEVDVEKDSWGLYDLGSSKLLCDMGFLHFLLSAPNYLCLEDQSSLPGLPILKRNLTSKFSSGTSAADSGFGTSLSVSVSFLFMLYSWDVQWLGLQWYFSASAYW